MLDNVDLLHHKANQLKHLMSHPISLAQELREEVLIIRWTWTLALLSTGLQSNVLSPFSVCHGGMSITNIYIAPAPYNGITMTILLDL